MYIKLKHIKQFLLVFTCLLLVGFNYFRYVKADNNTTTKCDTTIDSDCDGLTNDEEKLYGTDPNNPDTGNCGYSDGVNVKAGYNPLTCKKFSDPQGTGTTENSNELTGSNSQLTTKFAQSLNEFINSKRGQSITTEDIQNFSASFVSENSGSTISWDNLPDVDRTKISILKQDYSSLDAAGKKAAIQKDAVAYMEKMIYLLASNYPTPIQSQEDIRNASLDLMEHLSSLSTSNPDVTYFTDMGNRLDLFINQANYIEVPESMLELHIKFIRLIKGALSLRDLNLSMQDPVSKMILSRKIGDLTQLFGDFLQGDLYNYVNQLGD